MARKRRLAPNEVTELKGNLEGLKTIADYTPVKAQFAVVEIQGVATALDNLLGEEAQLLAQLGDLRDRIADKGTEFLQGIKGARQQIVAQYGDDSPEFQKAGGKRISERATRKPKPAT